MKTKTIYHPTLPVSKQVPEEQAQAWKDQGWRFTPPPAAEDLSRAIDALPADKKTTVRTK